MIKFIVAALWICGAALGAVYFAFQQSAAKPEAATAEPAPPLLGGLDYVRTEIMSVPVLRDSQIRGYFLARLVYTIEAKKLAAFSVPAEALIVDEVYSYIYGNPQVEFSNIKSFDTDAFRNGIKDALNKRVGEPVFHDVVIEQLDYLTKEEIRDNSMRRRMAANDKKAKAEKKPAGEAPSGH